MAKELALVENFKGMRFLNSPQLSETEDVLKIETVPVNANAIAIVVASFLLIAVVLTFFFGGAKEAGITFAAGSMASFMFCGLFYLMAAEQRTERLAFVNKEHDRLELPTGTTITRAEIECFRLYHCKTKTSNFRVLLLTAVSCGADGDREYAVVPVIGSVDEDRIGNSLAKYFETQLVVDNRKFTSSELDDWGVR